MLVAQVQSTVTVIPSPEGENVAEGDALVQLDDRMQRAVTQIAEMAAENDLAVQAAELTRAQAEIDLDNARAAFEADAASEWEFRRAILERNLAVLRILSAEQELESAKISAELESLRLDEYSIEAPFTGTVNRVLVVPGDRVSTGTELLELVDLSTLEAEIMLPVSLMTRLRPGNEYALFADAPVERKVTGTLKHASRVIDPASGTFRCVFEIQNADGLMPSGFRIWFEDAGG